MSDPVLKDNTRGTIVTAMYAFMLGMFVTGGVVAIGFELNRDTPRPIPHAFSDEDGQLAGFRAQCPSGYHSIDPHGLLEERGSYVDHINAIPDLVCVPYDNGEDLELRHLHPPSENKVLPSNLRAGMEAPR